MVASPDEFDLIFDALHAVRQVRRVHGSGIESVKRVSEIARMLHLEANGLPTISALQPLKVNGLALGIANLLVQLYGDRQGTPSSE